MAGSGSCSWPQRCCRARGGGGDRGDRVGEREGGETEGGWDGERERERERGAIGV